MARILHLTPQLPYPPQQGTSLRNYHLLRALAERHEVTPVSYTHLLRLSSWTNCSQRDSMRFDSTRTSSLASRC